MLLTKNLIFPYMVTAFELLCSQVLHKWMIYNNSFCFEFSHLNETKYIFVDIYCQFLLLAEEYADITWHNDKCRGCDTKSTKPVYPINKYEEDILGSKLTLVRQTLGNFLYFHHKQNQIMH